MSNVVEFPHESPPAPPTEEDRWTEVAFVGCTMAGMTSKQELHRFGGRRSPPGNQETVGRGKNQEQQPQGLR
jgi:hypothetical protein